MAGQKHDSRDTQAKGASRENVVTGGGVETPVEGFMGDITTSSPFKPTYGNHKRIGSEMLPTKIGGRGGSGQTIRSKLNDVVFRGGDKSK